MGRQKQKRSASPLAAVQHVAGGLVNPVPVSLCRAMGAEETIAEGKRATHLTLPLVKDIIE